MIVKKHNEVQTPVTDRRRRSEHTPDNLETQVMVWESYSSTRSARRTSRETQIPQWIVTKILHSDRDRMLRMVDEFMESMVSQWEDKQQRAQIIMDDLMNLCEGMVHEIKIAATEGRMTSIRDRDGNQMPVLDVIQFLVVSRLLDQVTRIATQASMISTAYRSGETGLAKKMKDTDIGRDNFEAMDDMQLAAVIRAGGLKLPAVLERKVKMIESKVREISNDPRSSGKSTINEPV